MIKLSHMELTWNDFFKQIKEKEYSKSLKMFLDEEYKNKIIYPPRNEMFKAFLLTPVSNLKVVIIGQDPYHEPKQAMGLCFSVRSGVKLPPSLINIYKEIENEYHVNMSKQDGDLTYLATQGCLLLNSILSVEKGKPLSHKREEYDLFFQDVLKFINDLDKPIVFMLWGGYAKGLAKYLNNPNHLILKANHPSPLSANKGGWFNNNHFILCNEYLKKHNIEEIKWHKN